MAGVAVTFAVDVAAAGDVGSMDENEEVLLPTLGLAPLSDEVVEAVGWFKPALTEV